MDDEKRFHRRPNVILGLFALCLLIYCGLLYDTQIVHGSEYLSKSSTHVTHSRTVESSRGVITDRNGKLLVSNREIYTVTFAPNDVDDVEGQKHNVTVSQALLRLLRLCEREGVEWQDSLPISREAPYTYTTAQASGLSRTFFQKFLAKKKWSATELTEESPFPYVSPELQKKMGMGDVLLPPATLLKLMRENFGVDPALSDEEARLVVGVLYELQLRSLEIYYEPYILAKDISVEFISILNDGAFQGAQVGTMSVRQYGTTNAAHILGRVGKIESREQLDELNAEYDAAKAAGQDVSHLHRYQMDDVVGKFGVEDSFEHYLCGIDGTRLITTNEDNKITSEIYSVEPQPGGTVSLTIDIDFQAAVEDSLGRALEGFNSLDGRQDRGAAAAVVSVKDSQVLALASYPTYDPANYGRDFNELMNAPGAPMMNRALDGLYAPGSTMKPCIAAAALESGIITPTTKILTKGVYTYWKDYQPKCWLYRQSGGTHGRINVSEALYHSCNYFFYDVGRQMGIETMNKYASDFGFSQKTGIELPEQAGVLDGPEYRATTDTPWVGGTVLQCAIGQGDTQATPLQLASYIATLLRGGVRYETTILKSVEAYDGSSTIYEHQPETVLDMALQPSTVQAVKKGMGDLAVKGSVAQYFKDCPVTVGAKTGSAQVGGGYTNGLFVCFAPFEDPEIAVAIAVEKVKAGANLAPIAAEIINAYFAPENAAGDLAPEGQLLP